MVCLFANAFRLCLCTPRLMIDYVALPSNDFWEPSEYFMICGMMQLEVASGRHPIHFGARTAAQWGTNYQTTAGRYGDETDVCIYTPAEEFIISRSPTYEIITSVLWAGAFAIYGFRAALIWLRSGRPASWCTHQRRAVPAGATAASLQYN